jgi:hypothetical protein
MTLQELLALRKVELVALCRNNGLRVSGTKAELASRLIALPVIVAKEQVRNSAILKVDLKEQPQAMIWKINPDQCDYKLLNPESGTFSAKRVGGKMCKGDYIVAVTSGKANRGNLLGIWQCIENAKQVPIPIEDPEGKIESFLGKHKKQRMKTQFRLTCKLVGNALVADNFGETQAIRNTLKLQQPCNIDQQQLLAFFKMIKI